MQTTLDDLTNEMLAVNEERIENYVAKFIASSGRLYIAAPPRKIFPNKVGVYYLKKNRDENIKIKALRKEVESTKVEVPSYSSNVYYTTGRRAYERDDCDFDVDMSLFL